MPSRNGGNTGWGWRVIATILTLAGCLNPAVHAQYQVFTWESNEAGALASSLRFKFDASPDTISVVDYRSPGLPPGLMADPTALDVCGQHGMRLAATPDKRFLSVVHNVTLQRASLGQQGKALVQADFYIPANLNEIPNMAVLAASEESGSNLWRTYRAGVMMGKTEPIVYFSFADETVKTGSPILSKTQFLRELGVPLGSWHRLQIIFDGQQKIICAVDGRPTDFSPIIETSLPNLQMGIMITTPVDEYRTCLADNLSIQWSPVDQPLPESPWAALDTALASAPAPAFPQPAGPSSQASQPAYGAPSRPASAWLTSPELAWQQATALKRPVLALFYTRSARSFPTLETTLTTDPSAHQLLSNFVPLRIDANQLKGGALAQKFGVFRVPTFLVVGPDGAEKTRCVYDDSTGWADTASRIRAALASR